MKPEIEDPPLLLKIPATGHQLSVSPRQVYDLVERGELELVKIGPKGSRITRDSILKLIAKRNAPRFQSPNLRQYATKAAAKSKRAAAGRRGR